MAEAPVAVLPYVLMFARLRYLLRVTFYSVGRFQTGFHGGYHSLFDFHSVCHFSCTEPNAEILTTYFVSSLTEMRIFRLLNLVRLELRSASESL